VVHTSCLTRRTEEDHHRRLLVTLRCTEAFGTGHVLDVGQLTDDTVYIVKGTLTQCLQKPLERLDSL
jgi:hypothetical protein